MKGIIWYSHGNRDKAIQKLKDIKRDYAFIWDKNCNHFGWDPSKTEEENMDEVVEKEVHNFSDYSIKFINGDTWRIAPACESQKASRCNVALIDNEISEDFINLIIMRCLTAHPYTAYNYY